MSSQASTMDPARTRLRETVAEIEKQMRVLTEKKDADDESSRALTKAWEDLVGQLALGPEPAVRACPKCKSLGFRMATVCGTCWTKLTPPADEDD